ncbi:MAG: hypothetical protein K2M44_04150 [Clostridia bacterium]|nr:hypothetical protein [Clostridia bacterium]
MIKLFKQPKRQLILTAVIAVCAVIAFGLFFADAITDPGGDGLQAHKIAFRVSMGKMSFNAAAFIAYLLPLIAGVLSLIPYPENKWNLLPAILFAAAGIMIEFMFQIYQLPFSAEIRQLHVETGEGLADAAIIAGWLCFGATACCLFKSFYKGAESKPDSEVICRPCEQPVGDMAQDSEISENQPEQTGDADADSISAPDKEREV